MFWDQLARAEKLQGLAIYAPVLVHWYSTANFFYQILIWYVTRGMHCENLWTNTGSLVQCYKLLLSNIASIINVNLVYLPEECWQ